MRRIRRRRRGLVNFVTDIHTSGQDRQTDTVQFENREKCAGHALRAQAGAGGLVQFGRGWAWFNFRGDSRINDGERGG